MIKDETDMKILRKLIVLILMVSGLALIFLPLYSKIRIKEDAKNIVEVVEEVTPEVLKQNDEKEQPKEIFDFSQVEEISPTGTLLDNQPLDKSLLIGQIVIPSLDMNLGIFKGTTKPDDKMGEGNYTLAGHNNGDKSLLFGSLLDIKKGAIIRITDKTTIYEYKVIETKIVPNTSLELIENAEADAVGKPIISLMTCDKGTWTSNRFFVIGKYVKKYKYDREKMESKE